MSKLLRVNEFSDLKAIFLAVFTENKLGWRYGFDGDGGGYGIGRYALAAPPEAPLQWGNVDEGGNAIAAARVGEHGGYAAVLRGYSARREE